MNNDVLSCLTIGFVGHCILVGYIVKLAMTGRGMLQRREEDVTVTKEG